MEKTSQSDLSLFPSFWSMQIADVPAAVWSCKHDEAPPTHELNGLATLREHIHIHGKGEYRLPVQAGQREMVLCSSTQRAQDLSACLVTV